MRRRLREALPFLTPLGVLALFGKEQLGVWALILLLAVVAWGVARVVDVSRSRGSWRLDEDSFEAIGEGEPVSVKYTDITRVEVQVSGSQRQARRGHGAGEVRGEGRGASAEVPGAQGRARARAAGGVAPGEAPRRGLSARAGDWLTCRVFMRCVAAALLVLLATACRDDRLVSALPPGLRVDTYAQQSASKVDVLWVVDNSGSMAARQENLARNFQAFITLFRQGSIDFRLAVATTDIFARPGELVGTPALLAPGTPDLESAFARNVRVGTSGSAYEAGLEAARLVLERQGEEGAPWRAALATCEAGCDTEACREDCAVRYPVPFLRPGAFLYLVFVTDEEDRSPYELRTYWRAFEQAQGIGNDGTVVASAIIGDVPANTCGATPGSRYAGTGEADGRRGGEHLRRRVRGHAASVGNERRGAAADVRAVSRAGSGDARGSHPLPMRCLGGGGGGL